MPVVLTFMPHYLPGNKSGGPVRSLANMVDVLGDEIEFRIVTSDRDLLDETTYPGITVGQWTKVGKAWVYYVDVNYFGFKQCCELISNTPFCWLYLNSFFSPLFSILPLVCMRFVRSERPILVAPRGEFSEGALALKATKKRTFLFFASLFGLYKRVRWQASSNDETKMICNEMGQEIDVVVARDLPDYQMLARGTALFPPPASALRIVFLSRIAPMKNLDFALKVVRNCGLPVSFDIWGAIEDSAYWAVCKSEIDKFPDSIKVNYRGIAAHDQVSKILGEYDLFFLPTLGENYGHAIAEAVSVGTPILISDRTPWRNLDLIGAGWDIPLEGGCEPFTKAIKVAFERNMSDKEIWRKRVYDFAVSVLMDRAVIMANRDLFC